MTAPTNETTPAAPERYPRTFLGRVAWGLLGVGLLAFFSFCVWTCGEKHKRKLKHAMRSEARVVIAALRSAQETYRAETSRYLSTSERGENDFYPAPGSEPRKHSYDPKGDRKLRWITLGAKLPSKELYCGYVVVTGGAGSLQNAGPRGRTLFGSVVPKRPWYYIRVRCGLGGDKKLILETTSESRELHEGGRAHDVVARPKK